MKKETKCNNCSTEVVIIENKMFYSGEKKIMNIFCPICNDKITQEMTDGFFFVQSKTEYLKEIQIDLQKEKLALENI
ncbi:hypothetical protein [Chryseobacterium sp. T1]